MNNIHSKHAVVCFSHDKHNIWLLHSQDTVYLVDPFSIEIEIITWINALHPQNFYCCFTQHQDERSKYLYAWQQIYPFQPIPYSPTTPTPNPYDRHELCIFQEEHSTEHCLLLYKPPYLFSGEILQTTQNRKFHIEKLSAELHNFLLSLPEETFILPSIGPIELCEFLPLNFNNR